MKQIAIFFILTIFLFGYSYSQIDENQPISKSDSIATMDTQEDIATSFSSMSEGQADEEGSASFIPSLLSSSQDVYLGNTSYNFLIAYFRNRGYDSQYQDVSINGFLMNSMINGRASFSQWGGLNHVMRWPERVSNMNPATFTFSNIGGATNFDTRASGFRKQIRASYALANRSYNNRVMLTVASGNMKGWSVVGSASARFGDALAYVPGTSYLGFAGFLGVEKRMNQEHALNFTAFVSPTVRGTQAGSVPEAFELAGSHYYNPNWGWYQGKKRNARMRTIIEPAIFLTHYFTPKHNKYTITTTVATSFGRNNTTGLSWHEAPDPRPDFYKSLPSYHLMRGDTAMFLAHTYDWLTNENRRQINWDRMYEINQIAKYDSAGPKRAQYILENKIIDHFELGGASNIVLDINRNIKLAAGVDIRGLKQHNYKTINDLLGGAFWLDEDKFSEGEFPPDAEIRYNNLEKKDAKLVEGDTFGYNYNFFLYSQKAWATFFFTYPKVDFHVGAQMGATEMWREGLMQNGRFPENSKGKSEMRAFFEGGAKAGVTYKISGRNYLVLNSQFANNAPSILNAFFAPRIRNTFIQELKTEKIIGVDLSYIMKYPFMKMRGTLFFTQFADITNVVSYYHDDNGTMVNYVMTGVGQRHLGAELGTEIKLSSMFSLILAGTFGDYRYSNNPGYYVNAENGYAYTGSQQLDEKDRVYWKNYFVAGSPQTAGTVGLKFNHNYWWMNINANFFDRIYCRINPDRRTMKAKDILNPDDPNDIEEYNSIVKQEKLKGQFTLDMSVSKSWRIKRYTIGFNISVTNITNNKNLVTTAWEPYRFDYQNKNVDKFQNKYYYAFGTTFFAGFNFTFN